MFSKVNFFLITALAATTVLAGQCDTGVLECCGSLQDPTSEAASKQLALVGVEAKSVTGKVGLQCNPITVNGAGTGSSCATTPVCCQKTFPNQLVGINCTPVKVGA